MDESIVGLIFFSILEPRKRGSFLYIFSIFYVYNTTLYFCYRLSMDSKQCAVNFIKTLGKKDKDGLRTMISHGIVCGAGYAKANDVNVNLFNKELKLILEEK